MSNELFQKVVDTIQVSGGNGGILQPDQANRFIDYMWDATSLGKTVRQVRMTAPVREIDKTDLGQRIARHATEGVDDHINASPTFSKITLSTQKIRLDWELTSEALEDNIEQANLEDHIARMMATQLGNDIEDLAINGDDAIASGDDGYALLKAFDGYRKLALSGGNGNGAAHLLSANGDYVSEKLFNSLYKALPRKWKARRPGLRFWTSSGIVQDYYFHLSQKNLDYWQSMTQPGTPTVQPVGQGGNTPLTPYGIGVYEVPLQLETFTGTYASGDAVTPTGEGAASDPAAEYHGYIELTHPDNRIWGVKREIKVYRKFAEKKDAIEYTVFTRQGVAVDNPDAWVVMQDVRVRNA